MPVEIRGRDSESRRPNRTFGIAILFVLLIALAGGVFIGLNPKVLRLLSFRGENTQVSTLTTLLVSQPRTMTVTYTFTPMQTATVPSATPTITDTPSPTPTSRPALDLEVKLGIGGQFLIHKVLEGDSLYELKTRYATTVDAIRAANTSLPSPLQPGKVIVIPVGMTDLEDYPSFEPYTVTGENIRLDALATQLFVNANDLAHYNNLSPDFLLAPGDWLLIPHPRSSP